MEYLKIYVGMYVKIKFSNKKLPIKGSQTL